MIDFSLDAVDKGIINGIERYHLFEQQALQGDRRPYTYLPDEQQNSRPYFSRNATAVFQPY